MFEIKNVSKKYKSDYAVRNLDLEIGSGLNFIVGSSGSGKTTLLKIISGMDNEFEGEVFYLGKNIKLLTEDEKSYYYNNKFGFIWQDFNLIEDMTVEENILLALHIKNINSKNEVEKVLKRLKITNLKSKKVKLLSGGQKQRVAIARELVKNPEVIIADEPTSALDAKTSVEVLEILKDIAKERTVIIVTHDTSLLDQNSKIYELDKGELISRPEIIENKNKINKINLNNKFKISNAMKVGSINNKSKVSRSIISCISIMISSILLMIALSGTISQRGNESFENLIKEYGNSILDINVVKSFVSASGGDKDEPQADVEQSIDGLYDKYINDERIEYLVFDGAFEDIKIEVEGKKYSINGSSSVPTMDEIILGNVPKNRCEVLVPESFVKNMGITNKEALGKEINFKAGVYNWESGQPELKNINIKAKIVGVANTKIKSNYNGESYEFELEDSFFFDKETLNEVNKQAGIKSNNHNFKLRVKDPKSLIEIKDEMSSKGIVPLGQFELVEDIVRLNSQANNLSKSSTIVISVLAIVGLITIAVVTSLMRKREYSIYKVCGYSKSQLSLVLFAENLILSSTSAVLILALSPVINILTKSVFGSSIDNIKTLSVGILISVILGCITYVIATKIAENVNPISVLKSGGR